MLRSLARVCAGAVLVAVALNRPAIGAEAEIATGSDARIREAALAFMRENGIPGLAIGVAVNGTARFYNFGVASKETGAPVTNETLFELGSISKTFAATLAGWAQVNGKLALDAPVSTYLPDMRGTPFGALTLINLGTHTGGGFPLQVPEEVTNDAQLMAWLKAWRPRYPAGTQRTYANPSIGMFARITAQQLGMSYADAVEKTLFPKLGLAHTFIRVPDGERAAYAQGYNSKDMPVRLNPGVLADEAYGVKSDTRDMLRFLEANMGEVGVEPELQRALEATHVGYFRTGPYVQDLVWEQYAQPVSLNDLVQGNANFMVLEDNPATALIPPLPPQADVLLDKTGATNGFGGYLAFEPARKTAIVILANRNHPTESRVRFAYRVLELVQGASAQ
ncbi:class C beta-lactamase [Paraburkholderia sp. J8-2]|uniref:class C beta-lactamase n=1 Tax=Paraburkholderia sp. J8-2 TaxID=2805440 RepID=UPI002AB7008E|nr:class C beta-lactamase [Paraburkholderia sp. J8-2]